MQQLEIHRQISNTYLDKEEYIKVCHRLAGEYEKNVLSHIVETSEFIKLAVKRGQADKKRKDLYFDTDAVGRVYEFFSFLKLAYKNKMVQFQLQPWQCWLLQELFGYYYFDDAKQPTERRYQIGTLFVGRKNGKTKFTAGIALYMMVYDREISPEIYLAATTREQAGQMLDYCKELVIDSKPLSKRVTVLQYSLRTQIRGMGKLKTVQSMAKRLDGLNPHFTCIDEYHAHPDDSLFNIFKTGMVQRENPLLMITSTAGVDKEGPFFKEVESGKQVLRGEAKNDRYFFAFFTLDNEAEIEQPDAWIKANPNLNVTIKLSTLVADYHAAKQVPSKLHNFIIKNLNVFQDQLIEQWIPDSEYKKCFIDSKFEELANWVNPTTGEREKLNAYIGIDLASTRDLASMVTIVEHPITNKLHVFPEFYFPNNPQKHIRGGDIDIREWIKKNHILEMESATIDQDFIIDRIRHLNEAFKIVKIGYDMFNAGFMITKVKRMEIAADACPQTAMFFNLPLKTLERKIFGGEMVMSTNPVMRWMFNNIVLYVDGNANIKILKNKSKDSVDGPVALGMAMGVYLSMNKSSHLFEIYKTA